ncbi:MAG TPA: response regulator [Burkholderiales bacterium]|nr:response regulator [Burkholderiales bacterium]
MSSAQVSVIDDDAAVLRSVGRLLQAAGYAVQTFSSSQDFLTHPGGGAPGCIVMDLSMPGMGGLDLQQALAKKADRRPVVFISGQGSIATSVAAMKAGAIDFLTKPFDASRLLGAVSAAIERDLSSRGAQRERAAVEGRLASLTPREREVLEMVAAGKLNKQIAAALGTAEKTVKVHRARMMRKMQVDSLAGLIRTWTSIQPPSASSA